MAGAHTVQNGTVLRLVLSHRIQMRMSDLTANSCSLSPILRAISLLGIAVYCIQVPRAQDHT